jgi:hypothetical protein
MAEPVHYVIFRTDFSNDDGWVSLLSAIDDTIEAAAHESVALEIHIEDHIIFENATNAALRDEYRVCGYNNEIGIFLVADKECMEKGDTVRDNIRRSG